MKFHILGIILLTIGSTGHLITGDYRWYFLSQVAATIFLFNWLRGAYASAR